MWGSAEYLLTREQNPCFLLFNIQLDHKWSSWHCLCYWNPAASSHQVISSSSLHLSPSYSTLKETKLPRSKVSEGKGTIRRGCLGSKLSTMTIKFCLYLFIGSRQTLINECFFPMPTPWTTAEAISKEKLIFGRSWLFTLKGSPQNVSLSEATLLWGKFLPCLF